MSSNAIQAESAVDRAKALPSQWFQNTDAKLEAYVLIVSELMDAVGTLDAQNASVVKTALEMFGSPCPLHSGENTPPMDVLWALIKDRCQQCDIAWIKELEARTELAAKESAFLADMLSILTGEINLVPAVRNVWAAFWALKTTVAPETLALVPECHVCHLPMTFQGQGYSADHQGDVLLFHCENQSEERPTGCWTQARIRVKTEAEPSVLSEVAPESKRDVHWSIRSGTQLIPPFVEYFTIEEALQLSIGEETREALAQIEQSALLMTPWTRLSDDAQRDLISAHDKEYHYESWPR